MSKKLTEIEVKGYKYDIRNAEILTLPQLAFNQ